LKYNVCCVNHVIFTNILLNQFDLKNEKNWKFRDYEDTTETSSNPEIMKILQIELVKFRDFEDITDRARQIQRL